MQSLVTEVFKREVKPALGCTELATIGMVSSLALNAALDNLNRDLKPRRKIDGVTAANINGLFLSLDPYLFKNAAGVGIPRTGGERGIKLAAALGMFGDARKGLVIFDSVGDECLKNAKKLTKLVDVKIRELAKNPDLYAEAKVEARGTWGRAIIQHMHDNVVLVESGGRNYFKGGVSREGSTEEQKKRFRNLTLNDLIGYVADLPEAVVAIVRKGMELVKRLSDEGLEKPRGIGVGYALKGSETRAWVKARTAAACDSRMFGSSNPSMAVAGSGNQGIAATAPIYAYAEKNRVDEDLLLRSVALSYLITIYATYHSSYLSAMCGCATKAGMGSTAGLAYYSSEGDDKVVKMAIQNFIAGVPGILCDGGKYSCALKLATVSDAVYQSVLLAMKNRAPRYTDGILGKNTEESIRNLGEVLKATEPINKTIVKIMSRKLK